jgi:hypothetical protein
MPRGGPRQGTPGKGYSNRTDLASAPDMSHNTAGTGGGVTASNEAMHGPPTRTPDDTPMIGDPSSRPGEPLTTGLSSGPGEGPSVLGLDPRPQEAKMMRKWLPMLSPVIDQPDTPDSVKMLFRYIRGA